MDSSVVGWLADRCDRRDAMVKERDVREPPVLARGL
jgi:hypothetical protein